jgi:hypothetical protein
MKNVTILLILFFSIQLVAYEGKVTAKSGLVLRVKGDTKAKKLSTIPYGTLITVEQTSESSFFKTEKTKGMWMKTNYNGKEGYVYGGFVDMNFSFKEKIETGTMELIEDDGEGDSAFSFIQMKLNGKYKTYHLHFPTKGIKLSELKKYNGKKVKITWKYHIVYDEIGDDYEKHETLLRIDPLKLYLSHLYIFFRSIKSQAFLILFSSLANPNKLNFDIIGIIFDVILCLLVFVVVTKTYGGSGCFQPKVSTHLGTETFYETYCILYTVLKRVIYQCNPLAPL